MAKLNILKIPIVLKIKQLQNLVPNENEIKKHMGENAEHYLENPELEPLGYYLPKDLSTSTLFTNQQLQRLLMRKKELDDEIAEN